MGAVLKFEYTTNNKVWDCIEVFLNRIEQNSINTRITYEKSIRDFFMATKGLEIEDVTEDDLIFSKQEAEAYQTKLRKIHKGSTVNNRIAAIKKLYLKLEDYDFNVKSSWFSLDRYREYDSEPSSPLTHDEVLKAIDVVSVTRKGFEKSILIRTAYSTGFRKDSIMSLKDDDMFIKNGLYYLKTIGKYDKVDYKRISENLYNDLIKLKESKTNQDKIFSLTAKTINKMMDKIRDEIDFGNRKITFHSFKKSSISEVGLLTGYDIKAMQRQGNHANASTTLNHYLEETSLEDLVLVDTENTISFDSIESMSKEDLLSLIKNTDRNTQIKILNTVKE